MNALVTLLTNGGYITSKEMEVELLASFPQMSFCVKWACAPRSCHYLKDIAFVIASAEAASVDNYAREVFLPVGTYDVLRFNLGIVMGIAS